MAHFAELDANNTVLRVIVVHNNELMDENGVEQEQLGIQFCQNLLGGTWKQTSYNAKFRKKYAGIGFVYDEQRDAFIPPKPFASWVLDETSCNWVAPVPRPEGDEPYSWDEETVSWILRT